MGTYSYLPTVVTPSPPALLSSILHPPWAKTWGTQGPSGAKSAGPCPPQEQASSPPCGTQPVTSTEVFPKDIPPSCSCSGLAGPAKEIWKGSCLKWHGYRLALAVGELISMNTSYFATLNQIFHAIPYHRFLSFVF